MAGGRRQVLGQRSAKGQAVGSRCWGGGRPRRRRSAGAGAAVGQGAGGRRVLGQRSAKAQAVGGGCWGSGGCGGSGRPRRGRSAAGAIPQKIPFSHPFQAYSPENQGRHDSPGCGITKISVSAPGCPSTRFLHRNYFTQIIPIVYNLRSVRPCHRCTTNAPGNSIGS
ncbi:hypothetical protein SAMN05216515_1064 [Eubacterium pyruvativorans]|uniref:Uncharacterized protein n=1 Tax=Eubacterium pyruvativorans TaxID=155865 RepID=A0A1I7G6X3_9FIRM|nr:hypothetical protein SAMN05216515_1064 [Eubacterium pyruvativorans]SFU44006.1 hypothetical protein SAMN05216508_1053 [Eubacterium pyruvativorans]